MAPRSLLRVSLAVRFRRLPWNLKASIKKIQKINENVDSWLNLNFKSLAEVHKSISKPRIQDNACRTTLAPTEGVREVM